MDRQLLLQMLQQQAPNLLSALTKPIHKPGSFADGEIPLDEDPGYYGNILDEFVGNRGYDPALIEANAFERYNSPYWKNSDIPLQSHMLMSLDDLWRHR